MDLRQFYRKAVNIKKISVITKYILFVIDFSSKKYPGLVYFIYRSIDKLKYRADPISSLRKHCICLGLLGCGLARVFMQVHCRINQWKLISVESIFLCSICLQCVTGEVYFWAAANASLLIFLWRKLFLSPQVAIRRLPSYGIQVAKPCSTVRIQFFFFKK